MKGENTLNHPDIENIMKYGYPSKDYLEWEREQERIEEYEEEEEE